MKKKSEAPNQGLAANYDQKIADTQAKIAKAIKQIKIEGGDFSVTNIASKAGISRPTIYSHIDYIDSLLPGTKKTKKLEIAEEKNKALSAENAELKAKVKRLETENRLLVEKCITMKEFVDNKNSSN